MYKKASLTTPHLPLEVELYDCIDSIQPTLEKHISVFELSKKLLNIEKPYFNPFCSFYVMLEQKNLYATFRKWVFESIFNEMM